MALKYYTLLSTIQYAHLQILVVLFPHDGSLQGFMSSVKDRNCSLIDVCEDINCDLHVTENESCSKQKGGVPLFVLNFLLRLALPCLQCHTVHLAVYLLVANGSAS